MKGYVSKPLPKSCDLCGRTFDPTTAGFYDARLDGRWGDYCRECFSRHYGRLGVGFGQLYQLDKSCGLYVQTAGGSTTSNKPKPSIFDLEDL